MYYRFWAGGSIAALLLSQKASVCIIERGKLVKPYEFTEKEDEMIPKLYKIGIDKDLSIISLSGNCVGVQRFITLLYSFSSLKKF